MNMWDSMKTRNKVGKEKEEGKEEGNKEEWMT